MLTITPIHILHDSLLLGEKDGDLLSVVAVPAPTSATAKTKIVLPVPKGTLTSGFDYRASRIGSWDLTTVQIGGPIAHTTDPRIDIIGYRARGANLHFAHRIEQFGETMQDLFQTGLGYQTRWQDWQITTEYIHQFGTFTGRELNTDLALARFEKAYKSGSRIAVWGQYGSGGNYPTDMQTVVTVVPVSRRGSSLIDTDSQRNCRKVGVEANLPVTKQARLQMTLSHSWLASASDPWFGSSELGWHRTDNRYKDGHGQSGVDVGSEFTAVSTWELSKRQSFYVGVSVLHPSHFLNTINVDERPFYIWTQVGIKGRF